MPDHAEQLRWEDLQPGQVEPLRDGRGTLYLYIVMVDGKRWRIPLLATEIQRRLPSLGSPEANLAQAQRLWPNLVEQANRAGKSALRGVILNPEMERRWPVWVCVTFVLIVAWAPHILLSLGFDYLFR